MKNRITKLIALAGEGIWEKEHILSLALLCSIAGESIFLLGPPGTAKSMIARRLKEVFKEKKSFEYLMSRFSTPDEIFGPVSIFKLKNEDVYERRTEGYLPSATVVFLDEIWKAGPAIQNALLTVINEKIYQNGNHVIELPMKSLIAASNELPQEDEGLEALWNRFLVQVVSNCISSEKTFYKMLRQKQNVPVSIPDELCITDDEYTEWQKQIAEVEIPDEILQTITIVREKLKGLEKKQKKEPLDYYISDRRWKKIIRLTQASAFLNGREAIKHTDLILLNHVLWNKAELIPDISEIVLQSLFCDLWERVEKMEKELESTFKAMLPALDMLENKNFRVYNYFYYKLLNYPTGNCFIFMSDYKYVDTVYQTDAILYWDDTQNGYLVRVLDINRPFASSQVNTNAVKKIKIRKTIDGLQIGGQHYKLEQTDGGSQIPVSSAGNKDLGKKLFESISSIKWDLSERMESMRKLNNLFISSYEVKSLKKEASLIENKINQFETKVTGMFKSSAYESQ